MAWDRELLLKRGIVVSDMGLDTCFNPWHRESRVYEHIDRYVENTLRPLFLEYYGTATLPYSSCPLQWRREFNDFGKVSIIVLELLDKPRSCPRSPLSLSEATLVTAKDVYSELTDDEYVHIYIHLREAVDILHQHGIIHGEIAPKALMNSVLFDFSKSWVDTGDLPCLDELFKPKPRTFEKRRDGELKAIRNLVLK